MKYENRRYNKNETGKQFYLRRKQEMNEILESDAYKKWLKKIWTEYKEKNSNLAQKLPHAECQLTLKKLFTTLDKVMFLWYIILMKANKDLIPNWTSYNQQRKNLNLEANIQRYQKQIRYCEWIISACIGASIALGFVIAHQMIITKWTW